MFCISTLDIQNCFYTLYSKNSELPSKLAMAFRPAVHTNSSRKMRFGSIGQKTVDTLLGPFLDRSENTLDIGFIPLAMLITSILNSVVIFAI